MSWLIFAAYALVVAVMFWIVFHDNRKTDNEPSRLIKDSERPDGGGMIIESDR